MITDYLREYLAIVDAPFEENLELEMLRVKGNGYTCYLKGDDFLNRICTRCEFDFSVPQENSAHMRKFLNAVNARIAYAGFVLDEDRKIVYIRSEAIAGEKEFIMEAADYLLTGLHKDAFDFLPVLTAVAAKELSVPDALNSIVQRQKSYDIFQPPWGGFPPNVSNLTGYELLTETKVYFMRNHKNFTTICTGDNLIFYAEPILGSLDINENRKSILVTGVYDGYCLQVDEKTAIEKVNTVNNESVLGCFYVTQNQIFFRVQHRVPQQESAEHDVSLLIQVLIMTMTNWFEDSFHELLKEQPS